MISNRGRCINTKTGKFLKPHKLVKLGKALPIRDPENMYYDYALTRKGKTYYKTINRLVAEYFIPIPQKYLDMGLTMDDLVVDHINNYRPDNRYTNLQWLTPKENYDKMMNSGNFRVASGHFHGMCKLTEEQLDEVGKLLEENEKSQNEISKITGVPYNTILEIRAKRRFRYLSEKYNIDKYDKFSSNRIDHDTIHNIMKDIEENKISLYRISKNYDVSYSMVKDIYKQRVHTDISKDYDFSKRKNSNKI